MCKQIDLGKIDFFTYFLSSISGNKVALKPRTSLFAPSNDKSNWTNFEHVSWKSSGLKCLATPRIITFQPQTFQPQVSTPDLSSPVSWM